MLPRPRVTSEFDEQASAMAVVAFSDRSRLIGMQSPTLESGPWTVGQVRARLDVIQAPGRDGESMPLWSKAVLFGRPFSSTATGGDGVAQAREMFSKAGVTDPVVIDWLVMNLNTAGDQLAVFSRYEPMVVIAHLQISVPERDEEVVVFDSTDSMRQDK